MSIHGPFQRLSQIAQKMPPVSDLDGLGSALCSALGVIIRAVSADDLHFGMLFEPRSKGF
jgi:hypothetical protein